MLIVIAFIFQKFISQRLWGSPFISVNMSSFPLQVTQDVFSCRSRKFNLGNYKICLYTSRVINSYSNMFLDFDTWDIYW
jgi:hypothetical protein